MTDAEKLDAAADEYCLDEADARDNQLVTRAELFKFRSCHFLALWINGNKLCLLNSEALDNWNRLTGPNDDKRISTAKDAFKF